MASEVTLQRCADYDPANVKKSIQRAIEPLGGISNFVKPGDSVLLKPNMLAPASPEKAVTTHPAVVRAVAEMVMEAGAKPFIADSPAIPAFKKIARDTGLADVAARLGIPIVELKDSAEYTQEEHRLFRILEISRHAVEADRIINLPKFKTHVQMFLTAGVKNVFGCVVGVRKARWHFKAGIDRAFFARMLVELYDTVSPDLTILDAIVGMEGDGPGTSGKPRQCGIISASTDAVAMDRVMLEIAGGKPGDFYIMQAARDMNIGETDLSRITIHGESIDFLRLKDFVFPKMVRVVTGPKIVQRVILNHFTTKPVEDREKCTLCKRCVEICPTEIISIKNERLVFNYDQCIRCFCCVEVCPEGAMKPTAPFLLRIVS